MAIPQIAAIALKGLIAKSLPGIPFVNKVNKILSFYVNVIRSPGDSSEVTLEKVTNYFIEHYFPEYYPLILDINNQEFSDYRDDYESLRQTISNSLI